MLHSAPADQCSAFKRPSSVSTHEAEHSQSSVERQLELGSSADRTFLTTFFCSSGLHFRWENMMGMLTLPLTLPTSSSSRGGLTSRYTKPSSENKTCRQAWDSQWRQRYDAYSFQYTQHEPGTGAARVCLVEATCLEFSCCPARMQEAGPPLVLPGPNTIGSLCLLQQRPCWTTRAGHCRLHEPIMVTAAGWALAWAICQGLQSPGSPVPAPHSRRPALPPPRLTSPGQ